MEKNCPNCNKPNDSDAAFCRFCATPLTDVQAGSSSQGKSDFDSPQNNQQWNQNPNRAQGNFNRPNNVVNSGGGDMSQKGMMAVGLVAAGLFCCGPFTGVPAAILGWMEMTAIKEGRSPQNNMWMAQVGLWGGIIVSGLGRIIGFLMMLMAAFSSPGYY